METNTKLDTKINTILVFIKNRYAKETLAYTGNLLPSTQDGMYDDRAIYLSDVDWKKADAPLLVGVYQETDLDTAKLLNQKHFPKANERVFLYVPAALSQDEINELCKI